MDYLPSDQQFCFGLKRQSIFASSFFIFYFWVWICPNTFRFHVSFLCHFFIPVCSQSLSRSTHPLIFSRLAGAQFADCITCLTNNHFVSVWTDTGFPPVHSLYFWVWTFLNMFLFHISFICNFSTPVCYKRLRRAIHLHIFSRPSGAQFADCITCLATNNFDSVWAYNGL